MLAASFQWITSFRSRIANGYCCAGNHNSSFTRGKWSLCNYFADMW